MNKSPCCDLPMKPRKYGRQTPITWECDNCGEIYGAVMAARHYTLYHYASRHRHFVKVAIPGEWKFVRYSYRHQHSIWKAKDGEGQMNVSEGFVNDWFQRRAERKGHDKS